MQDFFELEAAYLVIGVVALLITWFVSTRSFMSKTAPRRGLIGVLVVIVLMVGGHYTMTTSRMASVKQAFEADKQLLCESRVLRKVAQSVVIQKSRGWTLEGSLFSSPDYVRPFHAARCIVAKAINLR
jgi:uncharacterized membrane-anchored protein